MSSTLPSWIVRRLGTAKHLYAGDCGGTYGDALLIVSAAVSGIAARLWPGKRPGKGIDRVRFSEVWSRYADPSLNPNHISLPLLLASLESDGDAINAAILRKTNPKAFTGMIGLDTLLVEAPDVDLDESAVLALCPSLPKGKVREFSYSDTFYREARSALTHQFSMGPSASSQPMVDHFRGVSYTNDCDSRYRRVHFHMDWLVKLVESVGITSLGDFQSAPQAQPTNWWLKG